MNSKFAQLLRLPSLILAAALQVLPLARVALPAAEASANVLAIIFRWTLTTAAALGGVQAVSGASTRVSNALNVSATNGQPFSLNLTTSPDPAHYWTTTALPPGLALTGTSGSISWKIQGTPTVSGTSNVLLTAKDQSNSGANQTVTATLIINIAPPGTPPAITSQPSSLTVTQGQSANFTVGATGTAPLKYQWRFQGAGLTGKTNASLILNPVAPANAGNYDVIVSNGAGSVTSVVATLTVRVPPGITAPPASLTVTQNQNAAFSVVASGTAPLGYQWRFQGGNLNGQTAASITLNAVTTANAGNYDVIVSNSLGSVTSVVATLTVLVPAAILTPPASVTVTQGQSATFDVVASGTAPLIYFWRKNTTLVASGPAPSFTIANAQPADAGNYSVIVSNSAGTATSSSAALAVNPAPQAPFISAALTNRTVVAGSPTTFTIAAGGTAPLQYQWYLNNAPLPGQTSPSYAIANVQTADAGSYFAVVTNVYGSATSSVALLTLAAPPVITSQPQSRTDLTGGTATFTVNATSATPLSYQWRKNGASLTDTARITGSQGNSLSITGLQPNDAGNFTVVLTNIAGAVTSSVAVLTVNPAFAPLVVHVNGAGTVTPDYNLQSLQIGASYTMTATPAAAYSFSGWTGSLVASAPVVTFVMQSNLVLNANFIPVPAAFINAIYNGLFYEAGGVAQHSSGFFTAKTTSQGKYSGRITLAGRKYSLSGRFDSSGLATNIVKRGRLSSLIIELKLDKADLDHLQGQITAADNLWSADLLADRAVFDAKINPAPQAGTYTLILPGTPNTTVSPAGDGFGAMTINTSGLVKMKGVLADGSKLSQSALLSKSGQWPLYVSLYSGQGSILSWLSFANRTGDDLNGSLSWIRGQQPSSKIYPSGFVLQTSALGSKYTPPGTGASALNLSQGKLLFFGSNLSQNITNQIALGADNKVTSLNGSKLALSLTRSSGLFKGSVINPATGKAIPFSGALLQKQNSGRGFFFQSNQSGAVYFGP